MRDFRRILWLVASVALVFCLSAPVLHAAPAKPRAERPTYTLAEKWIRDDGAYALVRIEDDRYVFAAGPEREIHLTKDLAIAKVRRAQETFEWAPPPPLAWPNLIPSDADPEDLYATAFPMDELQTIFDRLESERVVVLLDTCYSGAAGGRTFASLRTRAGTVDHLFLERLARTKGRAIITASRPNEVSLEVGEYGRGSRGTATSTATGSSLSRSSTSTSNKR
jgi:hypothetical protein